MERLTGEGYRRAAKHIREREAAMRKAQEG